MKPTPTRKEDHHHHFHHHQHQYHQHHHHYHHHLLSFYYFTSVFFSWSQKEKKNTKRRSVTSSSICYQNMSYNVDLHIHSINLLVTPTESFLTQEFHITHQYLLRTCLFDSFVIFRTDLSSLDFTYFLIHVRLDPPPGWFIRDTAFGHFSSPMHFTCPNHLNCPVQSDISHPLLCYAVLSAMLRIFRKSPTSLANYLSSLLSSIHYASLA